MNLDAIPLFAMLKSRMTYLGGREKVLSENIANASTPGYAPHDLKPFSFEAAMSGQTPGSASSGLLQTQASHMPLTKKQQARASHAKPREQGDSEVTLDGNGVVLEEQMIKLNDSQMNYDAAISYYQKSLAMLRMAARAPGK